jgi:AcrR family transcriptional regulator
MPRLTRAERSEQIRGELVAVAHELFQERGFHGVSLEEISERAGYSRGAVYSNFDGKEGLFLAVLDAHVERRGRAYVEAALDAGGFEDGVRAVARAVAAGTPADPGWVPVLVEFWTHASHRPELRAVVRERHDRALAVQADLLDEVAARHGVTYRIPTHALARGCGALRTGLELERLLDPAAAHAAAFEEMFCALVLGLAE